MKHIGMITINRFGALSHHIYINCKYVILRNFGTFNVEGIWQKLLPYSYLEKYCFAYYFLLVDKNCKNPFLDQRNLP